MTTIDQSKPKEVFAEEGTSYPFAIIRPGGNDTGLVIVDQIPPLEKRQQMNGLLQGAFSNVEQVGFVNLNRDNLQLTMAGGEFCGNATRSTAFLALQGKPGEVTMRVSGVQGTLRAGVTEQGEAFAQMPIYSDPKNITSDGKNFTVVMEGITHYIDFDTNQIKGKTPDEIKVLARQRMRELGIDADSAAGVMYTEKIGDSWNMTPIVYVRDVDTLYYETACGSGTTALGLGLALQEGGSIQNVPIVQPSGLPISVSVDYDGKEFSYAQIQGPIEPLNTGTVETKPTLQYVIERIISTDQVDEMLPKLSELYQEVFGQAPYFESFTPEEVAEIFKEYVETKGLLFFAKDKEKLIGFSAAQPFSAVPAIAGLLDGAIEPETAWYMADLGVTSDIRRNGIARKLVEARLKAMPQGTTAVMRTSVDNIPSQSLYKSLGFTQVPEVFQQVEQTRTDGTTKQDTRLFLAKTL